MRFALSVQNFGAYGDPRLLAGLARDAEQAGWDGFFVWMEGILEDAGTLEEMRALIRGGPRRD